MKTPEQIAHENLAVELNIYSPIDYERLATSFAERVGIIDFKVVGNLMHWAERYPTEGTYYVTLDLNNGKETRTQEWT